MSNVSEGLVPYGMCSMCCTVSLALSLSENNCINIIFNLLFKPHSTHILYFFNYIYPYSTDSYKFHPHFVSTKSHTIFQFSTPTFHTKFFSSMLLPISGWAVPPGVRKMFDSIFALRILNWIALTLLQGADMNIYRFIWSWPSHRPSAWRILILQLLYNQCQNLFYAANMMNQSIYAHL